MAHSKDSPWSSEFIQELLPSAERTALLYYLSYLRLGKFPKLERLIRELNLETQWLFRCSEALIMKAISDHLILQHWKSFGGCCRTAQGVFSVQSKDVYKFLEINPSSLSEDERKEQYESVMMKLKQFSPQYSSTATITEI